MAECGTHTLCCANPGPYATGEVTLAKPVIDQADASMLVTADRNFYSYPFWQRAIATGAKLLFRVKRDLRLPREKELTDGSYLTTLYACDKDRRRQTNGTVVRVIEYALDGIPDPEPSYRLITNWLDVNAVPGVELAEQEFYALLLAHAAIRRLMTQAAAATDQAAEDLSFVHAVRELKRRLSTAVAIPP